jgi:hypothetical protein
MSCEILVQTTWADLVFRLSAMLALVIAGELYAPPRKLDWITAAMQII